MNDQQPSALNKPYSVAITGSGGSGAVTAGRILLEAAAHCGYQGLDDPLRRSSDPWW